MGMFPTKQFILDDTPQQYRKLIEDEFKTLNYGIQAEVEFSTDGKHVHDEIAKLDFNGIPFIFGSSWEKDIADQLGANYLNVSYPVVAKIIMNSYRAGYDGGLHLIEDIYSEALQKLIL
jgi:nitrogenase molybdenum-iron protein beta chain